MPFFFFFRAGFRNVFFAVIYFYHLISVFAVAGKGGRVATATLYIDSPNGLEIFIGQFSSTLRLCECGRTP